jgi:hypothetical protein
VGFPEKEGHGKETVGGRRGRKGEREGLGGGGEEREREIERKREREMRRDQVAKVGRSE